MALTRPRAYQIYDIDYKQSVRVVTISNITLSGGAPNAVDGVNLSLNDRILVTGQSSGAQNGIYYVTTLGSGSNGTWSRSIDTDATGELLSGTIVMVTEGTTYADTQWKLTTNDPITIGSTTLTFVQNYLANSISYGATAFAIGSTNANATVSVSSTTNVAVFGTNTITFAGNILPTSNVTYSLGTTTQRWSNIWLSNSTIYLGNITIGATDTQLTVNGSNVVTSTSGGNISTTGNLIGGNLTTSGQVSATANITGGNILTSGLISATGNINTAGAININSTDGNYNVLNISGTALAPYGTPQTWKFFTNNIALGGAASFILFPDSSTQTTAYPGTSTILSLTGNITGGNLIATTIVSGASLLGSVVSASANITGGNILTGGLISATGNITGNYILGNGSQLTGLPATYANSNVAAYLASGTDSSNIITTANVSGGNVLATTIVSGSSVLGSIVSVSANVTGGNLLTGGLISATSTITSSSNITGGNLLTGGLISATSNITGGNIFSSGILSVTGKTFVASGNATQPGITFSADTGQDTGFYWAGDGNIGVTTNGSLRLLVNDSGANLTGSLNITSATSVAGNITGGNINTGGIVSATGRVYGLELNSTNSSGSEGGQINLALPASGSTLSTGIIIDSYNNLLRFFEAGGTNRGAYIDLTAASAGVGTNLLSGGGGGTPGGSNTYVQFNDGGAFGGNGQFTYNKTTNVLTAGIIAANNNGAGTNFQVGDDAWIGDINVADTMSVRGQQSALNGYIMFGNADANGKLGRAGTGPITCATGFSATGNITGGNILTVGIASVTGTITSAGGTNGTGFAVGNGAVSNVGLGFFPTAGTRGDYAIRDYSTVFSNMYLDVCIGGSSNGAFQFRSSSSYNLFANINSTGVTTPLAVSATGNIYAGGKALIGVSSTTLTNPVAVFSGSGASYDQVALFNSTSTGSSDYVTYGNNGDDNQSWMDMGFTGNTFSDGNYTITGAGDGYIFAQGNSSFGGNMVVATGNTGTTRDIVFSFGFLTANEFVRFQRSTNTILPKSNITANLGSSTTYFNNVYAASHIGTTVSVTGNITGGGHVGTIYTNSIINTGANATGNIGSSTLYFNTAFVKATSAQYADVAEWYSSDQYYEPGTVVVFDGDAEVTIATQDSDDKVAGVVSTNPAYIMNAGIQADYAVPVALTGRVPTKVIGPVRKGNMMVSAGNGYAKACSIPSIGTVIGKAIENFTGDSGVIEIVVGRM